MIDKDDHPELMADITTAGLYQTEDGRIAEVRWVRGRPRIVALHDDYTDARASSRGVSRREAQGQLAMEYDEHPWT